jgi:acyl carrier protein
MSADAVTAGLTQIFREAFDDDAIVLHRDLAAKDIEGWDSMAHVRLILAIERHFRVRLPSTKIAGLKNVGDMIELINSCLASQHP